MARRRIRRKDLKKPDELMTWTGWALGWARQHVKVVGWVAGGLAVVVAMLGIVTAYRAMQARDANADLSSAMATLRADDFPAAALELDEVARRWDATSIGPLAALLSANTEIRLGNVDTAIVDFEQLKPSAGELPIYLQQQLLFAWGAALEEQGSWRRAARKYHAASRLTGPYKGEAMLSEARVLQLAGNTEKAADMYGQVLEGFPELETRVELLSTEDDS